MVCEPMLCGVFVSAWLSVGTAVPAWGVTSGHGERPGPRAGLGRAL